MNPQSFEHKVAIAVRLLRVNGQLRRLALKANAGGMSISEVLAELDTIQQALKAIDPDLTIATIEHYKSSLFNDETPNTRTDI